MKSQGSREENGIPGLSGWPLFGRQDRVLMPPAQGACRTGIRVLICIRSSDETYPLEWLMETWVCESQAHSFSRTESLEKEGRLFVI